MKNNVVDLRPDEDVYAKRLYEDLTAVIDKHIAIGMISIAATIGLIQIVQMETYDRAKGLQQGDEGDEQYGLDSEPEPAEPSIVTKSDVVPLKRRQPPYADILDLWRKILPELPQPLGVEHWTNARKAQIRARWKDELPELEDWRRMMTYISKSDFLMGRVRTEGRLPFRCDLFWITKPENLLRLSEGKYHQNGSKNGA